MAISECIILAGGLGTRLRSAVPDLPKCMAPVAGKPFLDYVISYLQQQGIKRYIFSLGYMHEVIEDYISKIHPELDVQYSIEEEPLGTGGAILLAAVESKESVVLIVNGDTLFKVNVDSVAAFHTKMSAACTLALKPMENFDRYGVVVTDRDGFIKSFKEKQHYNSGLINGGVYVLNLHSFLALKLPKKFSFEKDYLEQYISKQKIAGIIQDEYFIDIGIPEDFKRANLEL